MLTVQVGRGRESQALQESLDRLCNGAGGSICIQGEPGLGKTTLAQALAEGARQRGVAVRTGRALPEERLLGYGLLVDALGAGGLDPASAAGGAGPGTGGSSLIPIDHLRARLAELARPTGLVVVLDDLHCADAASIGALSQLVPLADLPVLWLLTSAPAAPGAPGTAKRLLARLGEVIDRTLLLEPLGDADARMVAEPLLGGRPGPRLERYLARAAGNPGFVAQLCRDLRAEGWIEAPGAASDGTPDMAEVPWEIPLTRGFRGQVARSLDRLPASTSRLVRLISVLGTAAPLAAVAGAARSGTDDVLRDLQPAFGAGLLQHDGDLLRFQHRLLREAVYESLPLSARLTAHERVGRCLTDLDEGRHYLAWHHLLERARHEDALSQAVSGPRATGSATTTELLRLLSADTSVLPTAEPETMRDLLGAVVDPLPAETLVASRLTLQKAWAEMAAGDIRAGERTATAVLEIARDPAVRIEALEVLAESLTLQRGYAAAVPTLTQAIDASCDDEVRARLRVGRAYSMALSGSLAEGMAELTQVHRTTMSPATRARAAAAQALGLVVQGHLDEAVALADEAIGFDLVDWGDPRNRTCPHYVLGLALLNADQWDRADDVIRQGIHCCEERERLVDLPVFLSLHATLLLMRGRWTEALAQAETGVTISESLGLQRNVVLLLDVIAYIAAERGHPAAAADAVMQAERILPAAAVVIGPNRLVRTKARMHDDPAEAYAQLTAAWSFAEQLDACGQLVELGPSYVSAALGADDVPAARAATRQLARAAARIGTAHARGTAEQCEGLVLGDAAALQRGLSLLGRSPRVLDRADALVDLAVLSAAQGNRAAARDAAQEALGHYRAFGAERSAAWAVETVTRLGIACESGTDAAAQQRTRCATGWDSLTPTERTVAGLVAEGLSNREIAQRLYISHRTVETHVSHALPKLGVRSRVGLAKAALTAGVGPVREGSAS